MCFKQCEIWKCFKTRCLDNHRLMGYPDPSGDEGDATTADPMLVKTEPTDDHDDDMDFSNHINVSEPYTEHESHTNSTRNSDYDPLSSHAKPFSGPKRKKKAKREALALKMLAKASGGGAGDGGAWVIPHDDSSDLEYTSSPSKKAKKVTPKALTPKAPGMSVSNASQSLYMKTYRDFLAWKTKEAATVIDEDLMLRYFQEIAKNLAPSTLTNKLSHLVKTVQDFHNVRIDNYQRLRQFCRDVKTQSTSMNLGLVNYIDG